MSFNNKNFSILAYSNGFTLWNYVTEDALLALKKEGYFNEISPFSRTGDMIFATAKTSNGVKSSILSVSEIKNGKVTLSSLSR